jgi:DNA polymerase-4
MEQIRKIIHIDMDAFYASVEQRDNPELRGKPVAVGGTRKRGVVAAASYEARKFGIRSAMSSVVAKRKCPGIIFVRPRMEVYQAVSSQIHDILHEYTDAIEPLSLDEAFLDVTENKKQLKIATDIAIDIKTAIKKKLGLTASAGVSFNKFLAKIASDVNKPDGLFIIKPSQAEHYIEELPVRKFFGVGAVTAEKMNKLGIVKGSDLKSWSLESLVRNFGKPGAFYYDIVRGIDNRPVNPYRIRKSIGAERTFDKDLHGKEQIISTLEKIEGELLKRLNRKQRKGRTLTLKVKFDNFEQITRSKSSENYLTPSLITEYYRSLVSAEDLSNRGVRLLGLTVSNLDKPTNDFIQLEIPFEF